MASMTLIRTSLDPLRASLFAALGLLAACGPGKTETESDSDSLTGGESSSSTTQTTPTTSGPTTTASATTDGGQTGTATGGVPFVCDGIVTDILQDFVDPPTPSGFVKCDGGIIHRPEARECLAPVTPTTCPDDASDAGGCLTDADCTEKPFGSCQIDMNFGGVLDPSDTCSCSYGCQTDADCGAGEMCRCAGPGLGLHTKCIPATCITDADCFGEICGMDPGSCAPGVFSSHCTTPADTCPGDENACSASECVWNDGTELWACPDSVCGRPFLVDGEALTAGAESRDDWRALLIAPTAGTHTIELAAYWTRIGLCEHASVASFARFILQLLAVGAPADLVTGAQQALADEVEHARLCFALASLYQGTGVGPGPMPAAGALGDLDLDAVLEAVIREACVGETLSALEAREAAACAEDPALRRVLAKIAADEQRHAELGWRFVQWALSRADADQRARADATFNSAIADAEATIAALAGMPATPALRVHGVIDPPQRAALWRAGLRELVRPTAAALRQAA